MREPNVSIDVSANLWHCDALAAEQTANDAFVLLRETGATFWIAGPEESPEDNPESELDDKGGFLGGILHPCLHRSYRGLRESMTLTDYRSAELIINPEHRMVSLLRNTWSPDDRTLDTIVTAHRTFVEQLVPMFRPHYGSIDQEGENALGSGYIRKTELRFIFWSNIFGPAYVGKLGREFLLGAPVWKATDLGEHGVSLTVTPGFVEWLDNPCDEVLDYFRKKCPKMRQYRSTGVHG